MKEGVKKGEGGGKEGEEGGRRDERGVKEGLKKGVNEKVIVIERESTKVGLDVPCKKLFHKSLNPVGYKECRKRYHYRY